MKITPIRNEKDYQKAIERLDDIFDAKKGTEEGEELEMLSTLIEIYENKNFKKIDMTPKEKAKELFEKMVENAYNSPFQELDKTNHNAKKCATICVKEIIETNPVMSIMAGNSFGDVKLYSSNKKYWQEVKKEIEKLK